MFYVYLFVVYFFFFKQKTAYEMRISDWSSDVCSSDLLVALAGQQCLGRTANGLTVVDHHHACSNSCLCRHSLPPQTVARLSYCGFLAQSCNAAYRPTMPKHLQVIECACVTLHSHEYAHRDQHRPRPTYRHRGPHEHPRIDAARPRPRY